MQTVIVDQLAKHGWRALQGGTAIASKDYETAVGIKTALVYFNCSKSEDEPNASLMGDYWSQGNNVLACGTLIPKTAGDEEIRKLADQFAEQAEAAILESYAARLHRKWGNHDQAA